MGLSHQRGETAPKIQRPALKKSRALAYGEKHCPFAAGFSRWTQVPPAGFPYYQMAPLAHSLR